jgi:hypothetical protein
MGYKLNEAGWEVAIPIAEKLALLKEGESLILQDSRGAIDQLRNIIYSWLYEVGKKPEFKVIRKNHESLEIKRKYVVRPLVLSDDKIASYVSTNLLEIDDESEVTRRIRQSIQCSELTSDEGIRVLSEWHRVQGRP